ncbi:tRNA dihydrouridine(20/20a) synthase DusA [Roseateles cavernae]|uniref:tRNA dihydrouridine(20/20a) synthase DusA n=1 Tax=Roseateles cavernae TaxID=3153578 RepID=UPI0032E46AFE
MPDSLDNSTAAPSPWRLSVAPMLDWTDKHCRSFHRLLTRQTRLYTEMVTTGALLHGDQPRHLDFNVQEHPVALQLGGSEPADLAACAKLAEQWGYDEVNLNCGCPSERVQRGAFGACLMAEPALVAEGMKAMKDAVSIPVTIKHRIGIDKVESYEFVRDFVGTIAEAGCEVFIVHARNAWLQGLSPKDNREIPPLRYELVHRLKREFPALTLVINGGLKGDAEIAEQLQHVDGVMVGRQAYHEPWQMAQWDSRFFGRADPAASREQVEADWLDYLRAQVEAGRPWTQAMRHALGLWNGQAGARRWRQVWSDAQLKRLPVDEVAALATRERMGVATHVAQDKAERATQTV